jgi:hypothetical protein
MSTRLLETTTGQNQARRPIPTQSKKIHSLVVAVIMSSAGFLLAQSGVDTAASTPWDLSSHFNARPLAPAGDRAGQGFRGDSNEKYLSNDLQISEQILKVNGIPFLVGPLAGGNNAILLKLNSPAWKFPVQPALRLKSISFLTISTGLNPAKPPADNGWGVVSVGYSDGTKQEERFIYRNFYAAPPMAPAFSSGVTDLESKAGRSPGRHIYGQTIPVDPAKEVASVEFDFSGIADGSGNDAEFAILALTGTK